MRIAYVLNARPPSSGVRSKIRDQVTAWQAGGNDVRVFGPDVELELEDLTVTAPDERPELGRFEQVLGMRRSVKQILDWAPDMVYHRADGLYPPGLARLADHHATVLEINADDLAMARASTSRRRVYIRATRNFLLSRAAGAVFIAHETAQRPHYADLLRSVPTTVIGNAIPLARYPEPQTPTHTGTRVVLLASDAFPWLGLDKVLWLAEQCPTWQFDIIGIDKNHTERVPPNVQLHGPLAPSAYTSVLASADIAVGHLSLHTIGMNEASSLKSREYLAHGLPMIVGADDPDIPRGCPLILRLPNTLDNVYRGLNEVRDFATRVKGRRVPRSAIEHLDVSVKERERLDFFKMCLSRWAVRSSKGRASLFRHS